MKLQAITSPLITSDDMPSSVMGMDAAGMDMAIYYMRDKIYSNKVGAVVREYACNAIDEHKKYNIDRPVELGIRENSMGDENSFYVRDYARGLSEHGIRNIFGMYFRSTKSTSNDQIGGFGVGAKSANCYTDTFYVTSHFEGTKTIYTCTLGGGSTSVPVGHIYKIGEEPTTESGIEISVGIKNGDVWNFQLEIEKFIKYCASPIIADIKGKMVAPLVPTFTQTIGEFVFKCYTRPSGDVSPNVIYRMGEVTYQAHQYSSIDRDTNTIISMDKVLVVEIPLGRMSLPVSRESFENTPSNNKIIANIRDAIAILKAEDMAQFLDLPVRTILDDVITPSFTGHIFSCGKSKIYPKVFPILAGLNKTLFIENPPDVTLHNNKPVVCIIPANRSYDYWRNLLLSLSAKEVKNYYYVKDSVLPKNQPIDPVLEEFFFFKKVKSTFFKFDKEQRASRPQHTYSIYEKFHGWKPVAHKVNALELHNLSRRTLGLDEAESIEDAQGQMDDMVFDDRSKLKYFTIVKDSGRSNDHYWTHSVRMIDNMKNIGWMTTDSAQYKTLLQGFIAKEQERREHDQLMTEIAPDWMDNIYRDKLRKRAKTNIKRAKQFSQRMAQILKENSFRSKILKGFTDRASYQFQNGDRLTREELRKIMSLR